jgi:hypothetical protein
VLIPKPLIAVLGRGGYERILSEVAAMSDEDMAKLLGIEVKDGKFVECHRTDFLGVSWVATYMVNREKIMNAIQNARSMGINGLCFVWDRPHLLSLVIGKLVHERYGEWIENQGGAAEVLIRGELGGVPIGGSVDFIFDDGEYVSVGEVKMKYNKIAPIQAAIYASILSNELGDFVKPYVVNMTTIKPVKNIKEIINQAIRAARELWNILHN